MELVQVRVEVIATPVEAFDGEGLEGVPGVMQPVAVVKLQTGEVAVSPLQLFLAMIFQ